MRTSIMLCLSGALLSAQHVAAQDSSIALHPGQVIRVSGEKAFQFTGEFIGGDSSGLVIRPSTGKAQRVPLTWIRKVEVRTAHKSGAGSGAIAGGTTGALLGLASVAAVDNDEFLGTDCCSPGEYASGAVVFGAVAGLVGAGIGALSHKDSWTRVPPTEWQHMPEASLDAQDFPVVKLQKERNRPIRP